MRDTINAILPDALKFDNVLVNTSHEVPQPHRKPLQ